VNAAGAILLAMFLPGAGAPNAAPDVAGGPCVGAEPGLLTLRQALDRREWSEAESLLETLSASHGTCARVVLGRARLLAARGDAAGAEGQFDLARRLAPDDPLVYAHFAQYWLLRGQPARADHLSTLALSRDPGCPEALIVQAQILNRRGRTREAREALEKAVGVDPPDAEAHYQLGVWCFRAKQRAEAVPHFEKVVALRPKDARAFDYLALSHETLGDADAAERAYRMALAVNDGPFSDPMLDHNYGRFLLKQGRLQESRTHLDRAVVRQPERRTVYYERAKLNLATRDYAAARKDAERALALRDPDGLVLDLQVYYLLATVYARLGETDLARKYAALSRTTPIPEWD
jgi:Tfp pilus assembly protein PilF